MAEARVLLLGGRGQVGSELRRLAPPDLPIVAPGRDELDISDPRRIVPLIDAGQWGAVINAAGYTAVDRAESDVTAAWRANALGPAILAEATARANIPLIHISTDYVFDGTKPGLYEENDPVCPVSVYGASKEGGEQAVRTANPRHVILRTAWLVSPHGSNFVKTMLRLAGERPVIRVVDDQRGSPTSATDLAAALITIAKRQLADSKTPNGTYHFVNDGDASWCEFARAVLAMAAERGCAVPPVEAISTADYPTAARRPANSRLSLAKLRRDFDIHPRPWQVAVEDIVARLLTPPEGSDRL